MRCSYGRWKEAQSKENRYWAKAGDDEIRNILSNYSFFEKEFEWTNGGTEILDIGCGNAFVSLFIKGRHTGLDTLLFPGSPMKVIGADIEIYRNGKEYDIIVASNMLDHCQNPEKAVENILQLMKDDAVIFVSLNTYNYMTMMILRFIELLGLPLRQVAHPHFFTEKQFRRLIGRHFKVQNRFVIKEFDMYKEGKFRDFLGLFNRDRKIVRAIGYIAKIMH